MTLRIGIDVGGTFTDFALYDHDRTYLATDKVLTTPTDPVRGILTGLDSLLAETNLPPRVFWGSTVVHGTTLATNSLIERKGAKTALITTEGARDVLETGRENRYDPYKRFLRRAKALIPRHLRRTITERVRQDGTTQTPIDVAALEEILKQLHAESVESIAVCLLNSYVAREHEDQVRTKVKELGINIPVSLSADIAPSIGEFVRTTTVAANAYIQPTIAGYLERLGAALTRAGHTGHLYLMSSDGLLSSSETTLKAPIRLLESGPAAGSLAAAELAQQLGLAKVIAFDMGGTTTKISLVTNGEPHLSSSLEAARVERHRRGSGLTIKIPSIELLEIGAGGGSLVGFDQMGFLTLGPESAGAKPGPACYGLGGLNPTVTDANLLLGYLSEDSSLAGGLQIKNELALASIKKVAKPAGVTSSEAAKRIRRLATEMMAQAIHLHVTEIGDDPRNYDLLAFGGAAPLHVYDVARTLGIKRIHLTERAGVLSSVGLLTGVPGHEASRTLILPLARLDSASLESAFSQLKEEARVRLEASGVPENSITYTYSLDMRYTGQGHDIDIPINCLTKVSSQTLTSTFEVIYKNRYGILQSGTLEIRGCRIRARGPKQPQMHLRGIPDTLPNEKTPSRLVWFEETNSHVETQVLNWRDFIPGSDKPGPFLLEVDHTTYVVGPSGRLMISSTGEVTIHVSPKKATSERNFETEVALARLRSVADEADRAIQRTAFSSVVRDAKDYSLVITDPQGVCIALPTECMPLFVTSMPRTISILAELFSEIGLVDGDVIITNDPWICAGHKSDIVLVAPVFSGPKLVAYVGTILHIADIGGPIGDFRASDIYEEGLSIPPVKLIAAGQKCLEIENLILANVRIPYQVQSDLTAMLTAIGIAKDRLTFLLQDVPHMDLTDLAKEFQIMAERVVQEGIALIPDDTYKAELTIDGPPNAEQIDSYDPVRLSLSILKKNNTLALDFSGSDKQLENQAINVPISYTLADSIYAVQYLMAPDIPNIGPQFSPVTVLAPKGNILSAVPPVPVYARTRTGLHINTLLNSALAEIFPKQVQAASGHAIILTVSGYQEQRDFFKVSIMPKGGMGATGGQDGAHCTEFPTNSTMIEAEIAESLCPIQIHRSLRMDSGGPGRQRGGLGQVLKLTSTTENPLTIGYRPNFVSNPPIGLLGGLPGSLARIEVNGKPPQQNPLTITEGDVMTIWTAGGGGIGDPFCRDPNLVRQDVVAGVVSAQQALRIYGVAIDPRFFEIDFPTTQQLRSIKSE